MNPTMLNNATFTQAILDPEEQQAYVDGEVQYHLDAIAQLMRQGHKVPVIKALKRECGLSLKGAYDLHKVLAENFDKRVMHNLHAELDALTGIMSPQELSALIDKAYDLTDKG